MDMFKQCGGWDKLALLTSFCETVRALLSCIDEAARWNINVVYPFVESYVRGTVALVGDSVSVHILNSCVV